MANNTPLADNGAQHLNGHVSQYIAPGKALGDGQTDSDGRIQVAAGNVSDGERHGHDGEAKGESHTGESDTQLWEPRGQDRGPAASEYQPERAKEFSAQTFH